MTSIVFWTTVPAFVLSLYMLPMLEPYSWLCVGLSFAFNLYCLYQSEHGGFVHSLEAPRSKEPPRHFTPLQTGIVILFVMTQFGMGTYYLLMKTYILL
ncbi:MAG: hypothetical protein ACE5G0_22610 [Rhodothermales bacterium]